MLAWLFGKKATKEALGDHKTVVVHGIRFVIRRVNPLLDFSPSDMPMIFAGFVSRRKVDPAKAAEAQDPAQTLRQMMAVVRAGLVEPELAEKGKPGIQVEDIFRDTETGAKLYIEIMDHTLNRFSGLRKVFFSRQIRRGFYTALQKTTEDALAK